MSIFSYDPLAAETWLIQNAMWINAVVSPTLLLIAAYMSWPHSKRYPARFMAIAAAPMLGLHFIEKTAFDALGNHYAVLDHFNEWVSPRVEITHTPLTLTLAYSVAMAQAFFAGMLYWISGNILPTAWVAEKILHNYVYRYNYRTNCKQSYLFTNC